MRYAPLKGDCIICQAPEPTRVAINAAIWPGEAMIRHVHYRAQAVDVAKTSKVEELAKLNVKTVNRHVEHIEASWREVDVRDTPLPNEVPVAHGFADLVDLGARLNAIATQGLIDSISRNPEAWAAVSPKETIAAAKLGLTATVAGENSRLKRNQQAIDVMALFAQSSGHVPSPPDPDDGDEPPLEVLRAAISEERRLLADRTD